MRDEAIVALVGNCDKTPQDCVTASYHLADGSLVQLNYDGYLFSGDHITKEGKSYSFIDESHRYIAPRARTLAPFKRLKVGMCHVDIDAIVGRAGNEKVTNESQKYLYKLSDGSRVWVIYANGLAAVRHHLKNGEVHDLTSELAKMK